MPTHTYTNVAWWRHTRRLQTFWSEHWFLSLWHLKGATEQPDTWIHMASFTTACQSPLVWVCVCSRVCVHTRCPLDVGGRCHQLFLDGPQVQMFVAMLVVRYWPTWYRIHKYMDVRNTCMQTCVWLLQDSCIHLGEWSHMWSCKSFVNVYEDEYSVQFQIKRYLKSTLYYVGLLAKYIVSHEAVPTVFPLCVLNVLWFVCMNNKFYNNCTQSWG